MDIRDPSGSTRVDLQDDHFRDSGPNVDNPRRSLDSEVQAARRKHKMPWAFRGSSGFRASKMVNTERFYEMSPIGRQSSKEAKQRQQINHSRRLPPWLMKLISIVCGVTDKNKPQKRHSLVGFIFYLVTLFSGLAFAASGAAFLYMEITSKFNNQSLSVSLAKATVGLYWIGLGIYSHSLSRRLFTDDKIAGWIRMHSKNFLGVNIMLLVSFFLVSVVAMNMYWDRTVLLKTISFVHNSTVVREPNCASIGAESTLCHTYYYSKILFSSLCTLWNLIVIGVCISVCRTHTVGIRRFQRELINDAILYEEFCKIQAMNKDENKGLEESWEELDGEDESGLVMDIVEDETVIDHHHEPPADGLGRVRNSKLLRLVTQIRQQGKIRRESERSSQTLNVQMDTVQSSDKISGSSIRRKLSQSAQRIRRSMVSATISESEDTERLGEKEITNAMESPVVNALGADVETGLPEVSEATPRSSTDENSIREINNTAMEAMLAGCAPPIMSNETLYYTYFQLNRRLQVASRLLQRWMVTWIAFALIWCCLLMFYWMIETFEIIGLMQICGTLAGLGLLATAYAEVNFEGDRIESFVMPSDERMQFLYYINSAPLHIKVYSMPLNHAVISTVVAGVIVTFATRIILKQLGL